MCATLGVHGVLLLKKRWVESLCEQVVPQLDTDMQKQARGCACKCAKNNELSSREGHMHMSIQEQHEKGTECRLGKQNSVPSKCLVAIQIVCFMGPDPAIPDAGI